MRESLQKMVEGERGGGWVGGCEGVICEGGGCEYVTEEMQVMFKCESAWLRRRVG